MNEEMKSRKGLYILLALLVAISIWAYEDEIGTNGGPRQIETTITDIPIVYVGEEKLADRGLMMLPEETTEGNASRCRREGKGKGVQSLFEC